MSSGRSRSLQEREGSREALASPRAAVDVPQNAAPAGDINIDAIRESIDLLEADLAAMIRDVQQTAGAAQRGVAASAEALTTIRERSDALSGKTRSAKDNAIQLAAATEEFAATATEIKRQVNAAGDMTGSATQAGQAARSEEHTSELQSH